MQKRGVGPKAHVVFGTRPEIIKLAPVIRELKRASVRTTVVCSSQHKQLLSPFLKMLDVSVDHDFKLMRPNQGPNDICSGVIAKLDKLFELDAPNIVIVQGDTSTALAATIAGFNRRIAVGHVEAGLRSGNPESPFPEEMNRRLISQAASYHFAATEKNRGTLLAEGIADRKIAVTGNPVVDSLLSIAKTVEPGSKVSQVIAKTEGLKRILLTTHRRESFGEKMLGNLKVLRKFVEKRKDTCLIFPVHPNPNVRAVTNEVLAGVERVFLLDPLSYSDFVALMKASWIVVSDSGGVQEEAPSLGKPLLVLRENTERPEAIESGIAKLVGGNPKVLARMLEENYADETWIRSIRKVRNPFGDGKAARRIVRFIQKNVGR